MGMPRSEYPRPQFERAEWLNLNGEWTCELDNGKSGVDRGLAASGGLDRPILVPFCPESEASGVGYKDFIEQMWYHRKIEVPGAWEGQRVLLRFGAVDFECEAFVDGIPVGRHWGGTSSFAFDITEAAPPGTSHDLVLRVGDELRGGLQGGGKQCPTFASKACHYTRTTGIWQTVWMEAVHPRGLADLRIVADLDGSSLVFIPRLLGSGRGAMLEIEVLAAGRTTGRWKGEAVQGRPIAVPLTETEPWSPGSPFLYEIACRLSEGERVIDAVSSYAGLRKVSVDGDRVLLNGKPLYQRLVLDQGFYPEGIWTAPDDESLKHDIELGLAAGFNGARLHQKVFEPRYHYWADKLGWLTWAESSSWGLDYKSPVAARNFLSEWREIVLRDRNHPSIIAWTPFNESRQDADHPQHRRLHLDAYELTHSLDGTRPVNDASGYVHRATDLYTVHQYEQDPARLRELLSVDPEKGVFRNFPSVDAPYAGQPYIVDEFGGIKWDPETQGRDPSADRKDSWGYGSPPRGLEDYYARLEGQVRSLLSLSHVRGYCFTQLTDVEQERNGIYYYDRTPKFDMGRIRAIFSPDGDR